MASARVITLDLNFQGRSQAIASYLIRHADGAVLIESGPGSTIDGLKAGMASEGLTAQDVSSHVLLTHIHLDHAGAAGWMARQGAQIYVHPVGAPHPKRSRPPVLQRSTTMGSRFRCVRTTPTTSSSPILPSGCRGVSY